MSVNWSTVPLGTVLTDIQPGFASGRHNSEGEGIPHFRPMNVSTDGRIERSVTKYVDPAAGRADVRLTRGDVLFNNTNSPELVGKTALFSADDSPAFSNHMTRLRTDATRLDPGYLAIRLHQAWREGWFAAHCNNHVSQASIGRDVLKAFEIELPPLDRQRAIASLAAALDDSKVAALSHLASALRAVERIRQAVLAAGCSGSLTADWREQYDCGVSDELGSTAPTAAVMDRGVPDNWVVARVADVGTVQLGGTPSRKRPDYWDGDVSWVSSGEVANCRIASTRETISSSGLANSSAKLYPAGTVLIAMIGEGKTRGQAAILDIEAATNQNAAGILANRQFIDPEYLWRWALAEYETTRAAGMGGNQPALNKQRVADLVIPVPPVDEQAEIVRRVDRMLDAVDGLRTRIETAGKGVDLISRAVLAKAFRGELVISPGRPRHAA